MAQTPLAVSVIIPTYNERDNLAVLIPRLAEALATYAHELIIVDDDSPDRTWERADELAATHPQVRCFRRIGKRGLASAVVDGFAMAGGRALVCIDADLQHDPGKVPLLVQALGQAEIAVATRYAGDGSTGDWSGRRRAMSRGATWLARTLLRLPTSDPMSGFFAIRHETFQRVAPSLDPRGYKILMELLARSRVRRVAEVPFVFGERAHGDSKLDGTVVQDYLAALWELRFGHWLPLRFVRYCLIGVSGIGIQMLAIHLLRMLPTLRTGDARLASALAIATAMLWNYILNNRWTFGDVRHRHAAAWLGGLARFALVCGIGAVISWSVAQGMRTATDGRMNIYFASLFGIAVATVWNYLINSRYTWKQA
jgi:dolichol-phosphate mannosyltransferase